MVSPSCQVLRRARYDPGSAIASIGRPLIFTCASSVVQPGMRTWMVREAGRDDLILSVVPCSRGNCVTCSIAKPFFLPIERGSNELVDINVAAAVEVNRVGEFGELFGAGARAAPERFFGRIVGAPVSGGEREEILLQTLRVLRAQPAVEQRALILIHPARIAGPAEDQPLSFIRL